MDFAEETYGHINIEIHTTQEVATAVLVCSGFY